MGANKGDVPNCCRKMPSLRRAGLPGSLNLPKQLRMSPLPTHGPSTRSQGRLSEDRGHSESEGKSILSIISEALQIIMIDSFSGDYVARRLCRSPRYGGFAPGY